MQIYWRIRKYIPAALRFKLDMRRCRTDEERAWSRVPPNTQEAHENGSFFDFQCEISQLHQWRRELVTSEYRRKLANLSVPMPSHKDDQLWEQVCTAEGEPIWCLTTDGEQAARTALKEEQKHRREVKVFWLTLVTGLGGILFGVISVWPK